MLERNQDPDGNPWQAAMWMVTALSAMASFALVFRQPQAALVTGVVCGAFLLATLVSQSITWELRHRYRPPRPSDGD